MNENPMAKVLRTRASAVHPPSYPQLKVKIWLFAPPLIITVILFLSGCSLIDIISTESAVTVSTVIPATPATPSILTTATNTPFPPALTPSPTILALSNAPTATPTATSTPQTHKGDILPTSTLSPTNTPPPRIACTVSTQALNLREGPGVNSRSIGTLPLGAPVSALKYLSDGSWLLVETAQQEIGWVNTAFVTCQGDPTNLPLAEGIVVQAPSLPILTATPTISPTPTPIATPPRLGRWQAEYYSNASLLGEPVLIREDPELEFNWILDSPAPGIPNDNFSVRWTGIFDFTEGGDYRFFATVDDGIKVYVDGWLVIDAWHTALPVSYSGSIADIEPGLHTIVVEYFESGGHAHVKVWFEHGVFEDVKWQGEYFDNRDLEGVPVFTRQTKTIDFDWGGDSPDNQLSDNHFSVRWRRTFFFDPGDYRFFAEIEEKDWVKVSLDGWQIIEEYRKNRGTVEGYFANLGGGLHTLEVEYQEHGGQAKIEFRWERQ